jgi:2-polyprenyl-6-methoxyphenol hydroxylase-like FAD-dependent oxidoreductase
MAHVIVVGAGPAGASLAYLLARRGVEVTLLERQSDFEREFRGEVLMPSAFEAFEQMGLAETFAAVPQVRLVDIEGYLFGRRFFRRRLAEAGSDDRVPRWVSQPRLLEMLVAEAGRFTSFRIERGATVRDLLRDGERVVGVRAQLPSGERELRGDLVVGADGRASVVRRRSGVPVRRNRVEMDVVWCRVPLPDFLLGDPHLRFYLGHGHLLIAAPTPDDALQLGWVIRKGRFGELRARGIDEWMDELASHVSPDLAEHLRVHRSEAIRPFLLDCVSARVGSWSAPGLLLIGDAAHTMSPVGAQGINIAIRDAVVAANELVPVLTGGCAGAAVEAAARRIEAERLPEVQSIQRLQSLPPPVVLSRSWWSQWALRLAPFVIGTAGRGPAFQRFAFGTTDVRLRV